MAEQKYSPSSSGYSSDRFVPDGWYHDGKNSWTTNTSTIIQGSSSGYYSDTWYYVNYYGVMYFDFATIRAKNVTHYPARIRLRLKSHVSSTRTVYVHMGKGMAKDTFTSGTRPTDATGTSVKTVSCAGNSWCEINTTDSTWLNALVDSNTTCFYTNVHASGYSAGSLWDTGYYWEGDGATATSGNYPELYIDWIPRNTAPNPPSSISITSTGFGTSGNVGGVTSIGVTCGAASDSADPETSLLYQFEYSVAGGSWTVLQSWVYSKSATLNLTSITSGQLIQFRVAAKDTLGAVSTYKTSTNYAYKIPQPSAPASISTPSTITTNSTSLSWAASTTFDSSVGVRYTVEIYDPKTSSWIVVGSALNALTTTMNAYTSLSLDEANKQYYYQTSNQIRVKAIFASEVQGQTLSSAYTTSSAFTIDFRVNPQITSFSVNYTGTTKGYEGVGYTVTITKGSITGNAKDSNGNAMQYLYKVDLLYGTDYSQVRNLSTTSSYIWGSLPSTVSITMPSNIITTADISAKIRVYICNVENGCTYPTDSSFTMKRYRNPVVNIKSFVRNSTDFSITFDVLDTGLSAQSTSSITSAVATFGGASQSYAFASSLTNLTLTFNSGITMTSAGIVTLVLTNHPSDSMSVKTGSDTQAIPQFLSNLRIAADGVYVKGALYVWDTSAVAHEVWHEGNDGSSSGLDADLLDGQHGSYYKRDYVASSRKVLGRTTTGAGSIEEIQMSGSADAIITGTSGTPGNLSMWNVDGDLVDGIPYVFGTFTPVLIGDTTNPTYTGVLNGRYVKIGKLVHFWIDGSSINITSAGSGLARIDGLPVAAQGVSGLVVMPIQYGIVSRTDINPMVVNATTRITLYGGTNYGTTTWVNGTANIVISGTYMAAS